MKAKLVKDNATFLKSQKEKKAKVDYPKLPGFKQNLDLLVPQHNKWRKRNHKSIFDEYMRYFKRKEIDLLWTSENYDHYIPAHLLGSTSAKLVKSGKEEVASFILYMSPEKAAGLKNMCAFATPECAESCLNTSGNAGMPTGQVSQRNKTILFLLERRWFMDTLYREIEAIRNRYKNGFEKYKSFCIRLNGTSDIPWENIKFEDPYGKIQNNIFEAFPDVQFYDYTKDVRRCQKKLPKNYDLTFSRAETGANQSACLNALKAGHRVAVVFFRGKQNKKTGKFEYDFPAKWHGYKVIDGDVTDLRYLDKNNVVVGLSVKGVQQNKEAQQLFELQKQGFFVIPDPKGSYKKAEKNSIFGVPYER